MVKTSWTREGKKNPSTGCLPFLRLSTEGSLRWDRGKKHQTAVSPQDQLSAQQSAGEAGFPCTGISRSVPLGLCLPLNAVPGINYLGIVQLGCGASYLGQQHPGCGGVLRFRVGDDAVDKRGGEFALLGPRVESFAQVAAAREEREEPEAISATGQGGRKPMRDAL